MSRAQLTVLSRDEIESIRSATLDLVEEVGIVVREPRAMALLLEAGATRVDSGERVLLPAALVNEAVGKVPKTWTWHAREPKHSFRVGEGGRTRLGPGSAATHYVDSETGKRREPTADDGDRMVRLMDALELVDINYTPTMRSGGGLPALYHEVATLARDFQNTSKPPVGPSIDGIAAKAGLEVAAILAGGTEELRKRPMVAGYCDPVSPLIQDRMMTETLIEYAAMGQPVFITCLDLAGASSPSTLAGTLLQQNAEILSALLVAYLVNSSVPVIYGCVSGAMDMRMGSAALGGPEFGLLSVASVQLAHSYGLPCTAGGQSDSKLPDAQASLEKATTLLASVLAGADFVDLFYGSFEGYNATNLEQVVIDHDIAASVFRYARGIEVTDETLSYDLIRSVGAGGTFMRGKRALEHALEWSRREHHAPFVADRRSRFAWEKAGGKSLYEAAREKAQAILAAHEPAPLDPGLVRQMDAIVERIRRESAGRA